MAQQIEHEFDGQVWTITGPDEDGDYRATHDNDVYSSYVDPTGDREVGNLRANAALYSYLKDNPLVKPAGRLAEALDLSPEAVTEALTGANLKLVAA